MLQTFMAESRLGLRPVVAADPTRTVRWVATSELDDPAPFLEGGELLLTTGISAGGWGEEWDAYVARLVAAAVAGLGLAVGLTHDTVPPALEAACRRHGLTLLEVPRSTTFVAISRFAAESIARDEQAADKDALTLQRRLTQAALNADDGDALLAVLADGLAGAAALHHPDGSIAVAAAGPAADRLDPEVVSEEIHRLRHRGLRASAAHTKAGAVTVVHPLGLQGTPGRYLAAWSPQRLDDAGRAAVTTAVALLGLVVERRNDQRDADRRLTGRAFELLVAGDVRTAELLLRSTSGARRVDLRRDDALRIVRGSGDGTSVDEALVELETAGEVLVAHVGTELWVLSPAARWEPAAEALVRHGLHVGVGGAVRRAEIRRSHAAAGHALAQATAHHPAVLWDQLVDEGLLALVGDAERESFATAYLAGLDDGRTSRADLEATLDTFLRLHGRIGPTAAELDLHRNTVRNRLQEVELLLGRSLDDPAVRVNAWCALQVRASRRVRA